MRKSLYFVLIAEIFSCFGQPLRTGPSVDIAPAFARQGVSITTFTDSNFQSKLASLLPADTIDELTLLLPYVVVVENHSRLPIVSTIIRYQRTKANGQEVDAWIQLNTETPSLRLAPEGYLIHTPRGDLSQMLTGAIRNHPASGAVSAVSNQMFSELFDPKRYKAAVVSVDSVTFKGGGIVGPDRFDLMGQDAASEKVRIEIAARLNDTSISDEVLRAWLQQQASQSMAGITQPDGSINHALSAQISWAKMALQLMNSRGRFNIRTEESALQPVNHFFRLDQ